MAKPIDTVASLTNQDGMPFGACKYCRIKAGKFFCSRAEAHDTSIAAACASACLRLDWAICPLNDSRTQS